MSGRLLLTWALVLMAARGVRAEPGELPAEERDRLDATARKLNQELIALYNQGKLLEALERGQQLLAVAKKLFPTEQFPDGHPNLANTLDTVASLLSSVDRELEGLEYRRQALAMRRKLYPPQQFPDGHPYLASSLNGMGISLRSIGRWEEALEYSQQAVAMRRKLFPPQQFPDGHPDLARSLYNVGLALEMLGRLEAALDSAQQALAMRQKLYSPQQFPNGHPDLANSLNVLGNMLHKLGRWEAALEHHQQALTMFEKLYPPQRFPNGHPDLVNTLSNMGIVLASSGRLEAALSFAQQSLDLKKKLYPPQKFPNGHSDLARTLNVVGILLQMLERLEPALEHHQQALAMNQKLYPPRDFPKGSLELARCLTNVGKGLQTLGRLESAREHSQQAVAMFRQLYPPQQYPEGHSLLATGLRTLGEVLLASRQYGPAVASLEEALVIERRFTDTLAQAFSEAEALSLARSHFSSLDPYLSATMHLADSAQAAYARVWIDRSVLSRILAQRHQAALAAAAEKPEVRDQLNQLQAVRRQLALLLLQPLPNTREALQSRDQRVNQLTQDKQRLERELVRLLPDLDQQRQLDQLGPTDLRQALPAHSAFVDLRRYQRRQVDPNKPGRTITTPCYVAFVVCPERPVQRVELEEAQPIEEALADWRHLIEQRREQDSPQAGSKLRRLVWDKIADALPQDTRTLFLAPDADLTRLPWAALPGSKPGSILLEDHALAVVPHGPFLLKQLRSARRFGQGAGMALVLGGIDYSEAPAPLPEAVAQRGPNRDGAVVAWSPLQGAGREARLLRQLHGERTVALEGQAAGVLRLLRELPQARLAHLATHGFFNEKEFRREQQRAQAQASEVLHSQGILTDKLGLRITAGASNPLSYTGLVLAGANQPEKAGPYGGILAGEAILDLNLDRLELAVLSACQTGLGDVANGECVHNLQHAFHLAGCPNVIAALWSVPDEATAALMGLFYHQLLEEKQPPLEALRAAQLYLYRHPEEIPELARRVERGAPLVAKGVKLPDPEAKPTPLPTGEKKRAAVKSWAGFVLSGVGR